MSGNPKYVEDDASSGSGEDLNMLDGNSKRPLATPGTGRAKRNRKATGDAIVDAMLEIAAASKMRAAAIMRNEERFAISKCIKVLDELQGLDQQIYFFALDLFENSNARETFISLKSERRLAWLQRKFSASCSSAT
ncbi:OLC1v1008559C1 [Oldenlandia corymbosa var. corymbosa]|uniref:OLC1v1008559C1 n=1 Tax=Oldenlandia corymbosa var. corymbosa TaxID=529605 RepID=A0AAV1DMF2_OLDCO|nr:OLC1v1008559C1 [Oldenlandia corymbosa var. corymbosa]